MRAGLRSQRARACAVVLSTLIVIGEPPCGGNTQPPQPEPAKLTALEVAVRLEKAGKDPVALLELLPLVDTHEAARLRQAVSGLLADRKQIASREEREMLTRALVRYLPAVAPNHAEVRELLGPPRQVLRQVLYRRYVEQWHYDTPRSLCVVFQGIKGQVARVQTVLVPNTHRP